MRNSWILFISFLAGISQAQDESNEVHYRMWNTLSDVPLSESTAFQEIFDDILDDHDWILERHQGIVTDDDYVLELWRMKKQIVSGKGKKQTITQSNPTGSPVLLGHGMQSHGLTWFCNDENSIAYSLANEDYDVWIFNNRITEMSGHLTMPKTDAAYWDISFDSIGNYDLPAVIDYITDQTSYDKLSYVGHSMGTTAMFTAMSSTRKDYYVDKLNSFVALAPPVRMNNIAFSLQFFAQFVYPIQEWVKENRITHLDEAFDIIDADGNIQDLEPQYDSYWDWIWGVVSDMVMAEVREWINEWGMEIATDLDEVDVERDYFIMAPTPLKLLTHFTQITKEEEVLMYKYVTDAENFEVYGQTNPPAYPIEEIDTIPIYIVSPTRDTLASRQDVQWLYETLKPNYKDTELVYALLEGGHSSPLQAKDMYEWIEAVQPFIGRHIQ